MQRERLTAKPLRSKPSKSSVAMSDSDIKLLEDLEDGLQIDEHALDEALQQQPDLFYRVSKHLAVLTSRRDAAKMSVAEAEAQADGLIRREIQKQLDVDARAAEKKKSGSRRPENTVQAIEAMKRLDPDVQDAMDDFLALNAAVGQFGALKEAFQQRSYVLKDLVSLYIANYYSDKSEGSAGSRVRTHEADNNRKGMAQERARRVTR